MGKIRILLVEDHEVVRAGLRALLLTEQNFEVVGEASDGREAVRLARETTPEVVIMDLSLPELNGRDAARQILRAVPGVKILVLSSYDEVECVEDLRHAGAAGFLRKSTAANHIAEAVRTVRSGRNFYSPELVKLLKERQEAVARMGGAGDPFRLTDRQQEVLQLIAGGLSNKEMAEQLGISIKTVEKHRQCVMNTLNIHETAGLTRYALKRGIIPQKLPTNSPVPAGHGI
jgi:DNA-binding NarL/FixJ family response regulator